MECVLLLLLFLLFLRNVAKLNKHAILKAIKSFGKTGEIMKMDPLQVCYLNTTTLLPGLYIKQGDMGQGTYLI